MPLPLPSVFTSGLTLFIAQTANAYSAKFQLSKEILIGSGPNRATIYIWGNFNTATVTIWVSALDDPDEGDDDDWVELFNQTTLTAPVVMNERSVWIRAQIESVGGSTSLNVKIL